MSAFIIIEEQPGLKKPGFTEKDIEDILVWSFLSIAYIAAFAAASKAERLREEAGRSVVMIEQVTIITTATSLKEVADAA